MTSTLPVQQRRRTQVPAAPGTRYLELDMGSQQRDREARAGPVGAAAHAFYVLRRRGLSPRPLDLGGGLPASYEGCRGVSAYGEALDRHLTEAFGDDRPETLAEPGGGIVGDAGTLVPRVIGVVHRSGVRWVLLDAGVFTGLVETLEEAIRHRLRTSVDGGPTGPCVLVGPTWDSADVLYEQRIVQLPIHLTEGDEVLMLSAGAYTSASSTLGFDGFEPLPTRVV